MTTAVSNPSRKPPVLRAFFVSAKNAVLGRAYALSVAFIDAKAMSRLNRAYRGKNAPTDILSFPLSETTGEIVLCMTEVRKQAPSFGRTVDNFLKFLFVHGLLHLKGYAHGSRMEREEEKFRKKFSI